MAGLGAIALVVGCFHLYGASGYSTDVAECGSPSSPTFTDGVKCTGCSFTALDINTVNAASNAQGCVAALSGIYAGSSAAKGYHCLTVRETGDGVTCSVHKTCGTSNTTDSSSKSCIYTMGGFSGISNTADCPADEVCSGGSVGNDAEASAAYRGSCTSFAIILGMIVAIVSGYSTDLAECGSPSNPTFTDGTECTGCSFTALDINTLNGASNAQGCVAALSGMYAGSSAAKGYHCLTIKETSDGVTCSVHKTCGSKNATDSNSKSCIYTMGGFSGISNTVDCPADEVCSGGSGDNSVDASGAHSTVRTAFAMILVFVVGIVMIQLQ